jgi:predicted nuclease of predicted toxin-antitoxin system
MKILLDMNIPLKYYVLLRERDIDAIRWSDIGAPDASDEEIMKYAACHGLIALTSDLDFGAILSSTHSLKPSVAQIRASVIHAKHAVDLIVTALDRNADDLKKGAILSINIKNSRLRLLPLELA